MKTTTIIMISIALAFLFLVEGSIIYFCSQMVPYKDEFREASETTITQPLQKFSSIAFLFDGNTYLSNSRRGAFLVAQSDSIGEPYIEIPDNLTDIIKVSNAGDILQISFIPPSETSTLVYGNVIVLSTPIIIHTPIMPDSIDNSFGNGVTILGHSDKNLAINSQGTVKFSDARLATVNLTNNGLSRDVDPKGPIFVNSQLTEIITDNYKVPLNIESDTLSSVKKLTMNGMVDYNSYLDPGKLKIELFIFEPADSASAITVTEYSKISMSFNNN
ncbi:MAG: hypothetical protein J1E38_09860 [Paramuribaculum sp.]|nr:hypothetical protein [Paramuribaculum sp.]